MTTVRPYLIMKQVGRENIDSGGYTSVEQWYAKYPDGTLREFRTPEWDGTSRVERRGSK